ncbi:MAG: hypothetical protein CMK82_11340 [Pseudomonadales bacterium]|nr:hypothetical protein [Pseudomonadales bacterium]
MSDKIKEALQKLDPTNENHWTADGSARLETVKFNNGGEAISREEIDKVAPGFTKDTAKDYQFQAANEEGHQPAVNPANSGTDVTDTKIPGDPAAVGSDKGNPTGVDAEGAPSAQLDPVGGKVQAGTDEQGLRTGIDAEGKPSAVTAPEPALKDPSLYNPERVEPVAAPGTSGLVAAGGLTESPRDDGAGAAAQASQPGEDGAEGAAARQAQLAEVDQRIADTDEVEDLEEELEAVEEALSSLRGEVDDLTKNIDEGNRHADKLRGRISQLKGSDQTNTIQAYLASRKEQLELRGENRATLKASGLTLKSIAQAVSAAPIDQAMARKNTRGAKRPTRV